MRYSTEKPTALIYAQRRFVLLHYFLRLHEILELPG